jgi:hypothetical protein
VACLLGNGEKDANYDIGNERCREGSMMDVKR